MIKTFNDMLALVVLGIIVALWGLDGRGYINLNDGVSGGLLVAFGLIIQFYFRRQPPNSGGG